MINRLLGVAILLAFLIPMGQSCTEAPETSMTYQMRRQVDTVVNEQRKLLNTVYDSVCLEITDSLIQDAYDSILLERLKQMQKIKEEQ